MTEGRGKYRAKASSLAIRFAKRGIPLESVRDETDLATGGELDCTQPDILTDMIISRIKAAA